MWTKCPIKIFSRSKVHPKRYEHSLKSHRSSKCWLYLFLKLQNLYLNANEWENTNKQKNNKTLHRECKSKLPPSLDQIISWSWWLHWLILIPQEEETRIFRLNLEVLGTNDFQLALSVFTIMGNSGIELVQGEESFQSTPNEHEKKKKVEKSHVKLARKCQWKPTTSHMHFHPSNLTILKVFPKSFPIETKPS